MDTTRPNQTKRDLRDNIVNKKKHTQETYCSFESDVFVLAKHI